MLVAAKNLKPGDLIRLRGDSIIDPVYDRPAKGSRITDVSEVEGGVYVGLYREIGIVIPSDHEILIHRPGKS